MNLYIETENGQPKNHPAFEDNLLQAFGAVPENWKPFERVQRPEIGVYEVLQSEQPEYQLIGDIYKDVWAVRDMTNNEIADKQQVEKNRWSSLPNRENFSAWVFDETLCRYVAPVPRPEGDFKWSGTKNNWVAVPPYPTDGKIYSFDITTEAWIPNE